MEETTVVTPEEGQDAPSVDFDEYGELKFSEKGLEGFKELLKDDSDEAPPEAAPEIEEEAPPPVTTKRIKVDGQEIEVSEDELISLAQQGRDYTRKTQQLAEERNALAPYEALITQLRRDPNLSQHIAKYWQPQPQAPQQAPQFDDPIDQLKYETKQEALKEMRAEMQKAFQSTVIPLHRQQALNQVKQQVMADPDYQEVHGKISEWVMSLPPSVRKSTYTQLDQDPRSYIEVFQTFKQNMAASQAPATQTKPQEIRRTERAPILESSNSAPNVDDVKSQRAKIDKAKARMLRDGGTEALQGFLEAGGFLEHLR